MTAVHINYASRRGVYIIYVSRTVVYIHLVGWSVFYIIYAYMTAGMQVGEAFTYFMLVEQLFL